MLGFSNAKLNFIVGIVFVVTMIGLYTYMIIPNSNNSNYIYYVHFQNVHNLNKGQTVYLNGYPIGMVESTFLQDKDAIAIISIDKSIIIPVDSSFNLATINILSDSKLLLLNLGIEEEIFPANSNIYTTTLGLSLNTIMDIATSYVNAKESSSLENESNAQ